MSECEGDVLRNWWLAMKTYYRLRKGYGEVTACRAIRLQGEQRENDKSQKAVAELIHFRNLGPQAQNCIHFCSRFQIL